MRAVVVAAGLAASLVGSGAGTAVGSGTFVPVSAREVASNRAAAWVEADLLLALAPVPDGAIALNTPPASSASPQLIFGNPGSTIDAARYWQIPMPIGPAETWLQANPPLGLSWETGGGGTGPGPVGGETGSGPGEGHYVDVYDAPASTDWDWATLEIGVVGDGTSSVLRADGRVSWLTGQVVRDTQPGPRIWVSATADCPAGDAGVVGVTNPRTSPPACCRPANRRRPWSASTTA